MAHGPRDVDPQNAPEQLGTVHVVQGLSRIILKFKSDEGKASIRVVRLAREVARNVDLRGAYSVRTASKSKKGPPTTPSPGDDS